MSVFPNKKPRLLGDPEDSIGIIDTPAIAGLTGDLTLEVKRGVSVSAISDGTTGVSPTEQVHSTIIVNVTVPNSTVFLFVETEQNGIFSLVTTGRIRKDNISGEVLGSDSGNGSNAPIMVEAFENNLPVGNHTYVFTSVRNATTGTWDTFPNTWNGFVVVIEPNDTHAGIITTPATATKQINSPDTHRTRGTEVII